MARQSPLARQLAQLRAELDELIAVRNPPRWVDVIVNIGEDKTEEIEKILGENHNVLIRKVMLPPPIVMDRDEELPPELKVIADETKERLAREAEEFKARCSKPYKRIPPPEERPTRLDYFPLKY